MNEITQTELLEKIKGLKNGVGITIVDKTPLAMRKTGNPYRNLWKRTVRKGKIGSSYETSVNRQGEREGSVVNFRSEPMKGKEWIIPNKVARSLKTGHYLLNLKSSAGERRAFPSRVVGIFTPDNKSVDKREIQEFLVEKKPCLKQKLAGVQEEVQVRTIDFSNIEEVRIGGERYKLKN